MWVYILVNLLLIAVKLYAVDYLTEQEIKRVYVNWMGLNIIVTAVSWGIGLLIHGLVVFRKKPFSAKGLKPRFIKKWEERQIEKYLEDH